MVKKGNDPFSPTDKDKLLSRKPIDKNSLKPSNTSIKDDELLNKASKKPRTGLKIFFGIIKTLILLMIVGAFVGAGLAGAWVIGIIRNAEPINPKDALMNISQISIMVDQEGNFLEKITNPEALTRTLIEYKQMPKHLIDAFVASEDMKFFEHNGLDFKRVFGALIVNIRDRDFTQGFSTITMQLARDAFLHDIKHIKSLDRKITEVYYALLIERELSKEEIFLALMNRAFFGDDVYGVQEAAQHYFAKNVEDLTLAESAVLVGLFPAPNAYSPYANYQVSKARQELVLQLMLNQGKISEREYNQAVNERLNLQRGDRSVFAGGTSYFADKVIEDALNALVRERGYSTEAARELLYFRGVRIYATIDLEIQNILDEAFKEIASEDPELRILPKNYEEWYDNIHNAIQPQASFVVIDHHTGQVKAMIGGRDVGTTNRRVFNRATQAFRSPGSAIKPLIAYLPLIEFGGTAATVFDDVPMYILGEDMMWPRNYGYTYRGLTTVREAINRSTNTIAVQVLDTVGITTGVQFAKEMGLHSLVTQQIPTAGGMKWDYTLSSALGGLTRGVTNLEITNAFATFASEGVYTEPITFTRIEDLNGNIILDKGQEKRRVISVSTARMMTSLLKSVVSPRAASATAPGANLDHIEIGAAGKTGTTSDSWDTWFVGYTPYYVAGSWIGSDDNVDTRLNSTFAARLWGKIMERIHIAKELEPADFPLPDNIREATICRISGDLATSLCRQDPREIARPGTIVRREIFLPGTEPTVFCQRHVEVTVATITEEFGDGRPYVFATEYTPRNYVARRILVIREPWKPGVDGERPMDSMYDYPTRYFYFYDYPGLVKYYTDNGLDMPPKIDPNLYIVNDDNDDDNNNNDSTDNDETP